MTTTTSRRSESGGSGRAFDRRTGATHPVMMVSRHLRASFSGNPPSANEVQSTRDEQIYREAGRGRRSHLLGLTNARGPNLYVPYAQDSS